MAAPDARCSIWAPPQPQTSLAELIAIVRLVSLLVVQKRQRFSRFSAQKCRFFPQKRRVFCVHFYFIDLKHKNYHYKLFLTKSIQKKYKTEFFNSRASHLLQTFFE